MCTPMTGHLHEPSSKLRLVAAGSIAVAAAVMALKLGLRGSIRQMK